jgi:S-adenosylmethionine decarboxylase
MIGSEWVIEAYGCESVRLARLDSLQQLFDTLVAGLDLHPVHPAVWHKFPALTADSDGGVTGMLMLSESHVTCHTYPEFGSICLNVFCCRPRPEYDFKTVLSELLGAADVVVRKIERPYRP